MTRINLVPVEELVDKHLVAEKHEITRVLALARNHNTRTVKIPPTYRMGTGHVTFFYNKIGFIVSRYHELCKEMRKRGFNVNELTTEEMLEGMPPHLVRGYVPDEDAVAVSRGRLNHRLVEMGYTLV